ncbi:MAG TPA: SDR family oxidoreductase, partial [Chitinophagaceae bacterium]|nr:SDR family oxidoreductase [Chitinophagaceae bacterium]
MDLQSDKDIVLIIGASSGLGLACFETFLEKGYQVVGASRRPAPTNGRGISMQVDVRKEADIKALHAAFLSQNRWPRVIVYCTGQGTFGPVKNYAETNWDNIFQTNVRGAFAVMGCFTPHMQEGSRIVLVGSTAARRPFKSGSVYVGSKAALHAYAAALREELRSRRISVTLCIPGT